MLEFVISSLDAHEVIHRDLSRPAIICEAPAPPPGARLRLPDGWTVVATGYTNAWVGDTPLLPQGSLSCDLVAVVKATAQTPAPLFSWVSRT